MIRNATRRGALAYVADNQNHRVQRFTADGEYVLQWGQFGATPGDFDWAFGVAVAPDGRVFAVDRSNHRIQKFEADGTFLTEWGSPGSDPGQFSAPTDVHIAADGSIFVTDYWNNRMQKFGSSPVSVQSALAPATLGRVRSKYR